MDEVYEELKLKTSGILKSKDVDISDLKKNKCNLLHPCLCLTEIEMLHVTKDEDLMSQLDKTESEL